MKKLLFTIMFLFSFLLTGSFTDFNSANAQQQVNLSIIKTKPIGHNVPRTPVRPPVVYLDDYTLTFESHIDYTLQVVSLDDETVVYDAYVPGSVSEVQLPSYLTGEYELRLYTDSFLFVGYVEL